MIMKQIRDVPSFFIESVFQRCPALSVRPVHIDAGLQQYANNFNVTPHDREAQRRLRVVAHGVEIGAVLE